MSASLNSRPWHRRLAAPLQPTIPADTVAAWVRTPLTRLLATLLPGTVIEVCSEASVPTIADLVSRAAAPGNAFTDLMSGAAIANTGVMIPRLMTDRARAALLLRLLTLPPVVAPGWAWNGTDVRRHRRAEDCKGPRADVAAPAQTRVFLFPTRSVSFVTGVVDSALGQMRRRSCARTGRIPL